MHRGSISIHTQNPYGFWKRRPLKWNIVVNEDYELQEAKKQWDIPANEDEKLHEEKKRRVQPQTRINTTYIDHMGAWMLERGLDYPRENQ